MTDPMINRTLGQYRLIEVIGRGGMATVYAAHQASLDRVVAVKVLHHHDNAEYIARFKSEARSLAMLQHPNILPVHDYGEQDGLLYLVLQHVPGGASMEQLVGSALPMPQALELAQRLLAGLQYAHASGIIHRDIKPANILMPAPDWPMLADFGLSKLLSDSGMHLTAPGTIMGTVAYMPPEQVTSQPIDLRSDIYSTGVVLYQLLTGRVPFDGATAMEVLVKHAYAPPPPPRQLNPSIPEPLEQVVMRTLAKSPADRYQSAAALAADLKRIAERTTASIPAEALHTVKLAAPALGAAPAPTVPSLAPPPAAQLAQAAPSTAPLPAAQPAAPPDPQAPPAPPARRWAIPAAIALLLAVVGIGAAVAWPRQGPPVAAPAPTTAPSAPATQPPATQPPAPTVAATEPPAEAPTAAVASVGDAAITGGVYYRDSALWSDAVDVIINGLPDPPAGLVYAAWLSSASGSLPIGVMFRDPDGAMVVSYDSPTHQNLLGEYDRVYIALVPESAADAEVANVTLAGAMPAEPLLHLRHAMFSYEATPSQIGYVPGLRRELDEAVIHAQRLRKNLGDGDLASAVSHAEHIVNVVEGQFGVNFGDLSRDGKIQNPGDGYGILKNGSQEGYIEGVLHHVLVAAASPAAPPTLADGAADIQRLGAELDEGVTRMRDLSLAIASAESAEAAIADADELLAVAERLAGEEGVEALYRRVHEMAEVALAPLPEGTTIDAPAPIRIAADAKAELVIVISDDAFTPIKQTVAAGTTIVWRNDGAAAHTVTADDGSFDSRSIPAGGEFRYTFEKAEAFPYFCSLHGGAHGEGMAGAVEVSGQP